MCLSFNWEKLLLVRRNIGNDEQERTFQYYTYVYNIIIMLNIIITLDAFFYRNIDLRVCYIQSVSIKSTI